jgi:hypothetical protein
MSENCAECGAPFGSAADLVEHVKKAHTAAPAPAPPPAPPPDAKFAAVDLAAEPEPPPRLACVFCDATFSAAEQLAAHNRALHLRPVEGVAEST